MSAAIVASFRSLKSTRPTSSTLSGAISLRSDYARRCAAVGDSNAASKPNRPGLVCASCRRAAPLPNTNTDITTTTQHPNNVHSPHKSLSLSSSSIFGLLLTSVLSLSARRRFPLLGSFLLRPCIHAPRGSLFPGFTHSARSVNAGRPHSLAQMDARSASLIL